MSRSTFTDDNGKASRYNAYIRTGLNFISQNRFKAATKEFLKAMKLDSEIPIAYNNLGSTFLLLADYNEAITYLLKSFDIIRKELAIIKDDSSLFVLTGMETKSNDSKHSIFSAFLSDYLLNYKEKVRRPLISQIQHEAAIIQNNLGLAYCKLEEYDKAINHFKEVLHLDSINALACSYLYSIYSIQEEEGKSQHFRNQTIKLCLKNANRNMQYSTTLANHGEFASAIFSCEEAIFHYELILTFEIEIKDELLGYNKGLDSLLEDFLTD